MIVIDTNVISELVKPDCSAQVVKWFYAHLDEIALPTPTVCELFAGVEAMVESGRKAEIIERYREICALFKSRILTFDMAAALAFPKIAVVCKRKGRPIKTIDCQIGAIAQVHRLPVATRDDDFQPTGVDIINPWAE